MENVRALQSLLAGVKEKVTATKAALAALHNRESVLEQMLAEEIGDAPPIDTINMYQSGDISGDSISGDKVVVHHPAAPEQWKLLGKTEAVERVLSEADQPLGPTEIMTRLEAVGLPQRDTEAVRGALAWMKRKGTARAPARSQWVLVGGRVDQRLSQEVPGPEEPGDEASPPEVERPVTTVSSVSEEESAGAADEDPVEVGR